MDNRRLSTQCRQPNELKIDAKILPTEFRKFVRVTIDHDVVNKTNPNQSQPMLSSDDTQSLTPRQVSIAIGVLLGDCSIQSQNDGKTHRLKFEQSYDHSEYIHHLYDEFHPWIISPPRETQRVNANGVVVKTYQLQTVGHPAFNFLNDCFHTIGGVKTLDVRLIDPLFDALSLAFWFMDDGGPMDYKPKGSKGLIFHTQGFTWHEVEALAAMLTRKFDLNCWVKENKKKPVIAVSGLCYERMVELIGPHLLSSMTYKFPTPRQRRDHSS